MNKSLEELLQRDGIQEGEDFSRLLTKNNVPHDPALVTVLSGISVNQEKNRRLKELGDTNFGSTLEEYQAVAESLGFRKVLEVPITGINFGQPVDESFFVYFRDKGGVLLAFDSYSNKTSINGGHFYYNWKPNARDSSAYRVTSSGSWHCDYPADMPRPSYDDLYPNHDGKRVTSGPAFEMEERRNKYFKEHAIWTGDHDCREALRHNIQKLEEFGEFVTPWVHRPHLWLCHFMDGKSRHGSNYKWVDETNNERLAMLPEDVRRVIG